MSKQHAESDRTEPPADGDAAESQKQSPAEQQPLSLDRLTSAFADMLGTGQDAPESESRGGDPGESGGSEQGGTPSLVEPEDSACEVSPRTILEAMLFVGTADNRPLTAKQVAELIRGVTPEEVDGLVRELNEQYAGDKAPYRIVSEGAGYRMVLREDFHRVRDRFYGRIKQVTLSQAAIEVLSLVAYHPGITKDQLEEHRGKKSGALLTQLVRRQLLRIQRPDEKPRKPHYYTTDRFLRIFHLKSLEDLPRSKDFEEQ